MCKVVLYLLCGCKGTRFFSFLQIKVGKKHRHEVNRSGDQPLTLDLSPSTLDLQVRRSARSSENSTDSGQYRIDYH